MRELWGRMGRKRGKSVWSCRRVLCRFWCPSIAVFNLGDMVSRRLFCIMNRFYRVWNGIGYTLRFELAFGLGSSWHLPREWIEEKRGGR